MVTTEKSPQSSFRSFFGLTSAGHRWWVLAGLLAIVTGCYWKILFTFFVQDDFFFLIHAQNSIPNIQMLKGSCFFRPLSTYWMTLLNVSLWGLDPFWHHLTHFTLFLATIAIFYLWLKEATCSIAAALVGASLFAFSKTNLYTLAWIAGGIDVSAGFFLILTLWAIARYFRRSNANGGRVDRRQFWLVGLSFCFALLSKESCVVIVPICLAWIAVYIVAERRRLYSAEWKLATMMIVIAVVYICAWKLIVHASNATVLQFNPLRAGTVLLNSIVALIPFAEIDIPRNASWLLLPLFLAAFVAADCWKRRRNADYLVLGLLLWVLSASIYMFTAYPWYLQLYYGQNSAIGLAVLSALAVRSLQERLATWRECLRPTRWFSTWRTISVVVAVALFGTWLGLASQTIRAGIRDRASPALYEADLAKIAYEKLNANLRSKQYQQVVFLKSWEPLWASMHGTSMMAVYFPDIHVECHDKNSPDISEGSRTSSTTLVVRLDKDQNLTVVR